MYISKRLLVGLLAATALVSSATLAFGHGGRGGHDDFRSTLAPSVPTDPAINGVTPGGAPWVLDRGSVRVDDDGDLRLRVRGLVIPSPPGDGTPGGVTTITASVHCGGTAADTSESEEIDRDGDARIRDELDLPDKCLAPVVLVHPNGNAGVYIAASGIEEDD